MSKISILCLFPPFHFCTVKTLQEDLLNSDFSNGHRAPLWGHRKTAATWFWWLIIRVIYLCLDNSTSTLKWPICACGPQVGHLVLHFQETQFQLIAGKNDQVSEKTSWWQTDNAYLVLCAQPPVSKRENICCVLGALSLTYPVFPYNISFIIPAPLSNMLCLSKNVYLCADMSVKQGGPAGISSATHELLINFNEVRTRLGSWQPLCYPQCSW